jgi:hypothetical protein
MNGASNSGSYSTFFSPFLPLDDADDATDGAREDDADDGALMLVDVVVVVVGTSAMLVSAMVEEEECAQRLAPWAKGYRIRPRATFPRIFIFGAF